MQWHRDRLRRHLKIVNMAEWRCWYLKDCVQVRGREKNETFLAWGKKYKKMSIWRRRRLFVICYYFFNVTRAWLKPVSMRQSFDRKKKKKRESILKGSQEGTMHFKRPLNPQFYTHITHTHRILLIFSQSEPQNAFQSSTFQLSSLFIPINIIGNKSYSVPREATEQQSILNILLNFHSKLS